MEEERAGGYRRGKREGTRGRCHANGEKCAKVKKKKKKKKGGGAKVKKKKKKKEKKKYK